LQIHDISITTTPETVTWDGGESGHVTEWLSVIGPDRVATVSTQSFGSHTGTHLDAPLHFIAGGGTVEQLDVNAMIGEAWVVVIDGPLVTKQLLEEAGLPGGLRRIVFKTENTKRELLQDREFHKDFVAIDPEAAQWLVDRGVVLVGIDYLSVGPYNETNVVTHRILLGAKVVAVEGLDLRGISPGRYFLVVLPPKFAGVEGCPCRAVLIEGLS